MTLSQLMYLVYAWVLLIWFDHKLWLGLYVSVVEYQFHDLQTQNWFFSWLSWNLVHAQIAIYHLKFFSMVFIFFSSFFLAFKYLNYSFISFFNEFNVFLSMVFGYNVIYRFLLFMKMKLSVLFFNNWFMMKMWKIFLYLSTFLFFMTRLDLNLEIWLRTPAAVLEVAGQLKAFKIPPLDVYKVSYLQIFSPLFHLKINWQDFFCKLSLIFYFFRLMFMYMWVLMYWLFNCSYSYKLTFYSFLMNWQSNSFHFVSLYTKFCNYFMKMLLNLSHILDIRYILWHVLSKLLIFVLMVYKLIFKIFSSFMYLCIQWDGFFL